MHRLAAENEAAEMGVSTSKSEAVARLPQGSQ